MGHVFVRLTGHGMVLVPHWPYQFERHPDGAGAVRVTRWTPEGPRRVVIRPGEPGDGDGVVDVTEGPAHDHWLVETTALRFPWPEGFTVESPRDPDDRKPFYLQGPGEASIFPQGPVPRERLADPDALVAPGQDVVDRRTVDGGGAVLELAYEHDGEPWWQGHWTIPYGTERLLVITAQSRRDYSAPTRAAAQAIAANCV